VFTYTAHHAAANYTPAGQISLLLSGTCLSVPYEANLAPIMQKLQEGQAKVPSTTPRTVGLGLNSGSKYASLSLPRWVYFYVLWVWCGDYFAVPYKLRTHALFSLVE